MHEFAIQVAHVNSIPIRDYTLTKWYESPNSPQDKSLPSDVEVGGLSDGQQEGCDVTKPKRSLLR